MAELMENYYHDTFQLKAGLYLFALEISVTKENDMHTAKQISNTI